MPLTLLKTVFLLFLLSCFSYAESESTCDLAPIETDKHAICWATYFITDTYGPTELSNMVPEATIKNGVWNVVFLHPAEKGVLGGGWSVAIRKDTGGMLEIWRLQ